MRRLSAGGVAELRIGREWRVMNMPDLKPCVENCAECKHHDVFWDGSGCNMLNNGERCKFEPMKNRRAGEGDKHETD